MKSLIRFSLIGILLTFLPAGRSAEKQEAAPELKRQQPLTLGGLKALEHASKLIAAINKLDWKTAEANPPKLNFLPELKREAGGKDWPGIGGYRGTTYVGNDQTLIHRFAYGPRHTSPHEVWFLYSIDGEKFTFTGLSVLGW
jgi:hypothetical protein